MVQHRGVGEEKGWVASILHQLLSPQCQNQEGHLPLPCMQETMESMVGAQHFSCMDLKSGFWQVKMAEESRQYTTFMVGSMGMYNFLCIPYGLCNAPATFQHLMQNCLGELNLPYALIDLDDMIVYSKTEEEHLIHLWAVLERFMEHSLESTAGMEPGTKGPKGIAEITSLATYTQVHKFLGTSGYFRHFIKGYTKKTKPLNDLLQGENSKYKLQLLELPPDVLAVFQELKMKCIMVPVLVFADFKKPFLPVGSRCLNRRTGSCPVPEARRWVLPPSGLCEPRS